MKFENQVAIITGGADGLGFALAEHLSSHGARVALFDIDGDKLSAAQTQLGDNCRGFRVDICDANAVRAAVGEVIEAWQQVDIAVNCAGITGVTKERVKNNL